MKKFFLNAVFAFGILTLVTSCLKNDGPVTPNQGLLLVAHMSPDAPALNITLNSQFYFTNLAYGFATKGYGFQNAGSYALDVFDSANNEVLSNTIKIDPNKFYSYFIIDSFSKIKYAFTEDKLIQPSSDSVYIRFLHFSPNAGVINLRDTSTKINYTSRTFNDQVINSSNAEFKRVKQGVYTLQLTRTDSSVLVTRKDTLVGGYIYTLVAKGFLGATDNKAFSIGKIQNIP